MPERDNLPEYLDDALDENRRAAVERDLQQDAALCDTVLRQRRLERALRVMLAPAERQEQLRASIRAAVRGMPMEELRDQVLSHTSGLRRTWNERLASWWQGLTPAPRLAVALATMLVLVAGALMFMKPAPASALRLAGHVDGVEVRRAGNRLEVSAGAEILAGDEIHAGSGALTLRFDREATTFTLEPETTVVVRSLAPQKKFELLQGALTAEVAKQRAGAMLWTTDNAEARVLGTKFSLTADGVFTRLDVERGAVELHRLGATEQTLVRAGQFAATDARRLQEARPQGEDYVWNVTAKQTLGFEHVSFTSETAGVEMGVNVLLPPMYAALPAQRFPVLYFLHDTGDDEHTEAARFGQLMRDSMMRREVPPFIAVFPNVGSGHTPKPWVMGQVLARELTRFVDERYRTITPRMAPRVAVGIGQGGHRALMLTAMQGMVFPSCVVVDDPLRGGPPGFRLLLERAQPRMIRFDRQAILLRSEIEPARDAVMLTEFLNSTGINARHAAVSAASPNDVHFPGEVWARLAPELAKQWARPGR